jgi:hypothetical protein
MPPFPRGLRPRLVLLFLCAVGIILIFNLVTGSPAVQAAWPAQILTSTPMPDGAIVHIVQEGENLASIAEAYGASMPDIRALNGMAPTSNLIFPGQSLIIRLPLPATETPTPTITVPRPTRTPTVITPSRTPRPTRTVTPTLPPSATPNPAEAAVTNFFSVNQRRLIIVMIVLCSAGLAWTLWSGFRPKKTD